MMQLYHAPTDDRAAGTSQLGGSPLEVNPQGQFLFVAGITGLDLKAAFVDYLVDEARKQGPPRHRGQAGSGQLQSPWARRTNA